MKTLIVFLPLLAIALARPQRGGGPESDATILRDDKDNIGIDGYSFAFDTSNGISRQEEGKLAGSGENEGIQVKGSYSYTDPSGKKVTVVFLADEGGNRPQVSLQR